MADSGLSAQPLYGVGVGEVIAHQPEMAFRTELLVVNGDDPRCFLPAVLERMKPERGQRAGILMTQNAENTAFFAQGICIDVERFVHVGSASHGEHSFVLAGGRTGRVLRSNVCHRHSGGRNIGRFANGTSSRTYLGAGCLIQRCTSSGARYCPSLG